MAAKKQDEVQRKAETRQALNKSGDTLDADAAVDAAINAEAAVREAEKVINTPDAPEWMPERWGNQRLTIATPGNLKDDPFYIPETVETTAGGVRRVATHRWIRGQFHILTPDGRGKYRWCSRQRSPIHKRYGFRFSSYSKLFNGTGLFESGNGDTIWNGDAVLMEISLDGWEKMVKDTADRRAFLEGSYGNEFFQRAQNVGAPSFKDDLNRDVREWMT
jgi:hypothetical protein